MINETVIVYRYYLNLLLFVELELLTICKYVLSVSVLAVVARSHDELRNIGHTMQVITINGIIGNITSLQIFHDAGSYECVVADCALRTEW